MMDKTELQITLIAINNIKVFMERISNEELQEISAYLNEKETALASFDPGDPRMWEWNGLRLKKTIKALIELKKTYNH